MPDKPFAESCVQNRDPILAVLRDVFSDRRQVLEIGSGTGQHAVYFGAELPHLHWQPSDPDPAHSNRSRRGARSRVVEAAIREYEDVWVGKEHLTECGLSRYYDRGIGPPPEVERGRFDSVFARAARNHAMPPAEFQEAFMKGRLHSAQLDKSSAMTGQCENRDTMQATGCWTSALILSPLI